MSSFLKRFSAAGSSFIDPNGKGEDEVFRKFGLSTKLQQWHGARLNYISKMDVFVRDRSIDIADRVEYMDGLINVAVAPWGRGRSDASWSQVYNSWVNLVALWKIFESQRHYTRAVQMVKVMEYGPALQQSMAKDGTITLESVDKWSDPKLIHESSYVSKLEADRAKKELDPKATETIKFLGAVTLPSLVDPTQAVDIIGFDPQQDNEEAVRLFGEVEVLSRGYKVISFGWHEKDVSVQEVMVFHSSTPNQQQGQAIIPGSKVQRPVTQGQPGVQNV